MPAPSGAGAWYGPAPTVSWSGPCGTGNAAADQLAPSSVVTDPFEPATRSPSAKVRPNSGSVNTIASSFTSPCCPGVTSFHVAFAGVTESSKETREICVPAMYIALPLFQFRPSDGSPAFWRSRTSTDWYPAGGDASVKRGAVELSVGLGGAGTVS